MINSSQQLIATNSPASVWQAAIHDPLAIATILLVLVTTGLWIFTGLLWRATVQLAKEAKESGKTESEKMERSIAEAAKAAVAMQGVAKSMEINADQIIQSLNHQRTFGQMQLRAYVTVLIGAARYQDANLRFEARTRMINSGHTPARNVRWRIAIDVLPLPLADDFRFPLPKNYSGGGMLGPQQDGLMVAIMPERLSDADAEAAKRGLGKGLFVWGHIAYEDLFRRTHRVSFAQQLYWEQEIGSDGQPREALRGIYLRKHNHAN